MLQSLTLLLKEAIRAVTYTHNRVTIKDSHFTAGSAMANTYLLNLQNITDLVVDNVKVENYRSYGGIQTNSVTNAVISNSHVIGDGTSPGSYGIVANGTNLKVRDNTVTGSSVRAIRAYITKGVIEGNYVDDDIILESTSEDVDVVRNILTGGSIIDSGTNDKIYKNRGYTTENSSTTTIASGNTYVDVSHGLNITPSINTISIIPFNNLGDASSTSYWVSDVGASIFRINVGVDPGASGADFSWNIGSY